MCVLQPLSSSLANLLPLPTTRRVVVKSVMHDASSLTNLLPLPTVARVVAKSAVHDLSPARVASVRGRRVEGARQATLSHLVLHDTARVAIAQGCEGRESERQASLA